MFDSKVVEYCFIVVLSGKACVSQVLLYMFPLLQTLIVKESKFFSNDKRNNIVGKTFLEHDKSAYSSVAILERMNSFKLTMEVEYVVK